MDPLAIGCIVGFLVVGGALVAGCLRGRKGPKIAKSSSGADLVGAGDEATNVADVDPVEF